MAVVDVFYGLRFSCPCGWWTIGGLHEIQTAWQDEHHCPANYGPGVLRDSGLYALAGGTAIEFSPLTAHGREAWISLPGVRLPDARRRRATSFETRMPGPSLDLTIQRQGVVVR